jgi:hypothetical protein
LATTLLAGFLVDVTVLLATLAVAFVIGLAAALIGALATGFTTFDVFVLDEDTDAFGGAFFCEVAAGLLAALTGFFANALETTFLAAALGAALVVKGFFGAAFFAGFLVDMFNP